MSSGLLEQYEAYQREHGTGKGKGHGTLSFTITEVPRAERGPGLPSGPEAEERGPGLPSGPQNEGDENSGGKGQQVTAQDLHAAGFSSFISAGSTSTSSARESPYAYGKDQSKGKALRERGPALPPDTWNRSLPTGSHDVKEMAKEETKKETKAKENYSHHGGRPGKWTRRSEFGTGTRIHIGMQTHSGIGMRISTGKTTKNLKYSAIILTIEVGIEGQDLELILLYHVEKGQLVVLVNFHVPEITDWLKSVI